MPGVTEQEIAQAKQMNLYQYMQRGINCPFHGELRKMSQTKPEKCRKMSQEGMNYD